MHVAFLKLVLNRRIKSKVDCSKILLIAVPNLKVTGLTVLNQIWRISVELFHQTTPSDNSFPILAIF